MREALSAEHGAPGSVGLGAALRETLRLRNDSFEKEEE